jgi:hypothetical protein
MPLPPARLIWVNNPDGSTEGTSTSQAAAVEVPVYINDRRTEYLFSVKLLAPSDVPCSVWYQRGIALSAWADK